MQRQIERVEFLKKGDNAVKIVRKRKAVKFSAIGLDAAAFLDKPTPERMRQQDGMRKQIVLENPNDRAGKPRYRARAECMLDAYLVRGNITDDQHAAGIVFRDAYQRAVLRIQTRNFMMVAVDEAKCSPDDKKTKEVLARRMYKEAMAALSMEQREVLIDVCGNGDTAGGGRKLKQLANGLQILADLWRTKRDDDFLS